MQMVTAMIKPYKLDEVRDALHEIGVKGITVTEVKGSKEISRGREDRGDEHEENLLPKIKIETAVEDFLLSRVTEAICQAAHTGRLNDGKIHVSPLEQVIRIRTGETGYEAL